MEESSPKKNCMHTAYVREQPPHKRLISFSISIFGTWNVNGEFWMAAWICCQASAGLSDTTQVYISEALLGSQRNRKKPSLHHWESCSLMVLAELFNVWYVHICTGCGWYDGIVCHKFIDNFIWEGFTRTMTNFCWDVLEPPFGNLNASWWQIRCFSSFSAPFSNLKNHEVHTTLPTRTYWLGHLSLTCWV